MGRCEPNPTKQWSPGPRGLEVDVRLRRTLITDQARVIFMSGYADDAVVRHGFLPKGALFLQKPFTLEQFTRKIREVLDTSRRAHA